MGLVNAIALVVGLVVAGTGGEARAQTRPPAQTKTENGAGASNRDTGQNTGRDTGRKGGSERTMRLLAFGDSLTAGFNLPHEASFAARLEASLRRAGRRIEVINAGVSGDTTASARARLDWVMRDRFDAAIVELGANDALRGVDPERTHANLDIILTRLSERGPVLLAGMLAPPNLGWQYGDAFKDVYRRLAERHPVVFYSFFLDGIVADPALNQGDGIHPTEAGVDVIVERILPSVEELLDRVPAGSATAVGP